MLSQKFLVFSLSVSLSLSHTHTHTHTTHTHKHTNTCTDTHTHIHTHRAWICKWSLVQRGFCQRRAAHNAQTVVWNVDTLDIELNATLDWCDCKVGGVTHTLKLFHRYVFEEFWALHSWLRGGCSKTTINNCAPKHSITLINVMP